MISVQFDLQWTIDIPFPKPPVDMFISSIQEKKWLWSYQKFKLIDNASIEIYRVWRSKLGPIVSENGLRCRSHWNVTTWIVIVTNDLKSYINL